MTIRFVKLLAWGAGAAVLALPLHAGALQIDGLPALEPVAASAVTPTVSDGRLQVALSQERPLTVEPWPAFLPQRFDKQAFTASRQLRPAGPYDRLSFSRANARQPWLEIGSGARPAMMTVGAWRLELSGKGWSVKQGRQRHLLGDNEQTARPAAVMVGKDRWCIYLLDSTMPQSKSGIATESEPQMAWAAVRLDPPQRRCRVPR